MIFNEKIQALLKQFASLFDQRKPSEAILRQLRRDGLALTKSNADAAVGHAIIGMVAGLEFNEQEFISEFNLSLARHRGAFERDRARLCRRLGYHNELLEIVDWMLNTNPVDVEAFKIWFDVSIDTFNLDDALRIEADLANAGEPLNDERAAALLRFKNVAARLHALRIVRTDVVALIAECGKFMRSVKEPIFGTEFIAGPGKSISYAFKVRAAPQEVVRLKSGLANYMRNHVRTALHNYLPITVTADAAAPAAA